MKTRYIIAIILLGIAVISIVNLFLIFTGTTEMVIWTMCSYEKIRTWGMGWVTLLSLGTTIGAVLLALLIMPEK